MTELLLSILALTLGPLFVVFARRLRSTATALDAFVLVAVGGLVLLNILPESLLQGGWPALICCGLGFFAPVLTEMVFRPGQRGVLSVVLILAITGLAAHSVLDGIGLSVESGKEHNDEPNLLAWAIILHRLPVGIGIWWIIPRTLGKRAAVMAMMVCVIGSGIGYGIGEQSLPEASRSFLALFQAFLGGSLLHVVGHAHVPPPEGEKWGSQNLASALGALSAIAALAFIVPDHAGDLAGSGEVFMDLARESAPALLLAYLLVGLSKELLPQGWINRIARGSKITQAMRGVAIGLPLPICSCGIVPVYRELIVRGAPSAAALAFLIATPELEVAAILLTWQLMGTEVALARILAAGVLAMSIGLLLGKASSTKDLAEESPERAEKVPVRKSPGEILRASLRFGFGSAVDHTAAWILVGLGISALLLPHIDPEIWAGNNLDVPIAAALGLPIYVCASGSTPLVAVLVMKGLSPGAALAFLLTGPATNLTTFGMLRQLHGTRVAATFALSVLILACALGYAADYLLAFSETAQQTKLIEGHSTSWVDDIWLWALAAVFLASLFRQGTRPFVEQLFSSPGLKPMPGGHGHK